MHYRISACHKDFAVANESILSQVLAELKDSNLQLAKAQILDLFLTNAAFQIGLLRIRNGENHKSILTIYLNN